MCPSKLSLLLTSLHSRTHTNKYASVPESYPDVTFTFHLQRNSPSYRAGVRRLLSALTVDTMMMPWQVILPCLVTMLLVVASFLLPPTAGEKILVNSACFIGKTMPTS